MVIHTVNNSTVTWAYNHIMTDHEEVLEDFLQKKTLGKTDSETRL